MSAKGPFRIGISSDFPTLTGGVQHAGLDYILNLMPGIEWEYLPETSGMATPETLSRYDAVIVSDTRFTAESFRGLERLVVISRWGVGFDRIDVEACTEASVILAITTDSVGRPVAEGALGLILALAKNFRIHDRNIRAGRWRERAPVGSSIAGKTLGVVGFGNIGRELCQLARGVGFETVLAYTLNVPQAPEAAGGVRFTDLETVMRESDFVSIHCPLNAQTRGLIGARQLALMKPSAYLINTARGAIVDEPALVEALREHRIAGAGLDVFETEPIPAVDPLLELENVILLPHVIARTHECIRHTSQSACRNAVAAAQGKLPPYIVNRDVLERRALKQKLARYQ